MSDISANSGPYYVRLEYLENDRWKIGHGGIRLLNPARYVDRLKSRGKVARAICLDTGTVWGPQDDANAAVSDAQTPVKAEPAPDPLCDLCDEQHALPHDGGCLI